MGSGTHAQITSKVISRLEKVVIDEKPNAVLIYGDTNSTLAAAIVVSKLNIPLFHVEAVRELIVRRIQKKKTV